ncbi:uncharacterized protein [Cherax quadricarinatus]|nr:uncharacterized protein LOC128687565 [Cherax quadricarinatus]
MSVGGKYAVNDAEQRLSRNTGWCGVRFLVLISVISSTIVYLIGSVITGVTYRTYGLYANCTFDSRYAPSVRYVYDTPLVVVGPCFMSAGGAILVFLLFQWCFCRPLLH